MKKENDSNIADIFKEIQTWENAPINELLGAAQKNLDHSVKRVIVYGPTQVGKTTLIMDLIGIKTELQKDLEKILRGGALKGTSSTSCAIIYNRWDDNCFGLRLGDINGECDSELMRFDSVAFRKKIKDINAANRSHAENKADISTHDILFYYIPDSFFTEDAPNKDLQIVDLPGFGERNEQMRKKADEIIRYLSGIVAGAIVVVKSENIQKLETDYKSFIDQHHQNHLAIVVSYALKTSSELKDKITALTPSKTGLDDRALSIELSEYYRNLIKQEGYMQFDDSIQSQIVFPVEHSVYLDQNYPELTGVFAESRKLLRERVERMKNRTSIEACIDALQQRQKKLEECVRNEKKHQCELDKELVITSKACIDIEKRCQEQAAIFQTLHEQLNDWIASLARAKAAVNQFSKRKLMTEKQASEFWRESSCNAEKQQSELYIWLYREIDGWLKEFGSIDKELFVRLQKCIDQVLGSVDLGDMFTQRDRRGFLWLERYFGPDSRQHACWKASRISAEIQEKMKAVINSYERTEGQVLQNLDKEAKNQLLRTQEEKKKYDRTKADTESQYAESAKRILSYDDQIRNNLSAQKNVKRVFIEYYEKKEKELCLRIDSASEPEIKAALFLTLSAINMTMKPYLEEGSNG